ncbi:MAG: hypothetical protein R6V60_18250, partial [Desulfobacterales bacterium]
FDWPGDNVLTVPVINEAVQCYSLADNSTVFEVERSDNGLNINLTGDAVNEIASVIVLDIKGAPEVTNQQILQDENGGFVLKPEESDLENRSYITTDHAKLLRGENLSYITWKSTRTWMEWPVEVEKAVYCDVYATVAVPEPGNKLLIQFGDESMEFDLPETAGLSDFQEVKLGSLDLPAGTTKIIIKGNGDNWQEFYFSKIELRPASEVLMQRYIIR